jgi:hypothetical protein
MLDSTPFCFLKIIWQRISLCNSSQVCALRKRDCGQQHRNKGFFRSSSFPPVLKITERTEGPRRTQKKILSGLCRHPWEPDAEASGSVGESPLKRPCVGADPSVCPGRTQGFAPTARFHLLSLRIHPPVSVHSVLLRAFRDSKQGLDRRMKKVYNLCYVLTNEDKEEVHHDDDAQASR